MPVNYWMPVFMLIEEVRRRDNTITSKTFIDDKYMWIVFNKNGKNSYFYWIRRQYLSEYEKQTLWWIINKQADDVIIDLNKL